MKMLTVFLMALLSNNVSFAEKVNIGDTLICKNDTIVINDEAWNNLTAVFNGSLKEQISSLQEKASTSGQRGFSFENMTLDSILLIALAILVVVLFILFFIYKNRLRGEILKTLLDDKNYGEGHRLQDWLNYKVLKEVEAKIKTAPSTNPSRSNEDELRHAIVNLQKRIANLEDCSRTDKKEFSVKSKEEQPMVSITSVPSPQTLYADTINEGVLSRVTKQPNEDTVYELLLNLPTDKTATFTIYVDAYRRVLKNSDFIEGCEKQRLNQQPTGLDVESGIIQLQDNGKWLITRKVKVKFI